MLFLILTSLLWAASFGLIKRHLVGLDPTFVAWCRLVLALVVFAPFLRPRVIRGKAAVQLIALGTVQYGVMYLLYIQSYQYLAGHEVALFTALTPLHVVLLDGLLERHLKARSVAAGLIAVGGAVVLAWGEVGSSVLVGFGLVQAANFCFAVGQVSYRRIARNREWKHSQVFAWLYLGAVLLATAVGLSGDAFSSLEVTRTQLSVLLYLGVIASGLGFFLWNVGATQTSAPRLAVMNNLKAPLAAAVALLVFGESADPVRLGLSSVLLAAALLLSGPQRTGKEQT